MLNDHEHTLTKELVNLLYELEDPDAEVRMRSFEDEELGVATLAWLLETIVYQYETVVLPEGSEIPLNQISYLESAR